MTEKEELEFQQAGRDTFLSALSTFEGAPFPTRMSKAEKESILFSIVIAATDLVWLRDDANTMTEDARRAIDQGISLAAEQWLQDPENPLEPSVSS